MLTRLNDVACGVARAIVCCVPRVVKVATAWGVACAPERSSPCPYACHGRPAGCARACACTLETCHVACCVRRCMYGCTLRVLLDTHRDRREHASLPSARLPASQYVRTYVRTYASGAYERYGASFALKRSATCWSSRESPPEPTISTTAHRMIAWEHELSSAADPT